MQNNDGQHKTKRKEEEDGGKEAQVSHKPSHMLHTADSQIIAPPVASEERPIFALYGRRRSTSPGPCCIKLTINGNFAFNGNFHRILDADWLWCLVAMVVTIESRVTINRVDCQTVWFCDYLKMTALIGYICIGYSKHVP